MKSSQCQKYEQFFLKYSALSIQGRIFQIFRSYFGQLDDSTFSSWNFLTFKFLWNHCEKLSFFLYPLRAPEPVSPIFCGAIHSRNKQRTDQRVLLLTLKFLALKKLFFPLWKILPKIFLTFVYLYSMQLSVRTLQYFQKNK